MPRPIPYALINGARASFVSNVVNLDGQEFAGFKSISIARKRSRSLVMGNNPDPLGKTRGTNEYTCTIEVYVAEFKAFVLDHFGAGYGDRFFTTTLTITENGFDVQTHQVFGCTIDETTLDSSQGTDGTTVKLDFMPVKIKFDGIDDNSTPLQGAPAQG